MLNKIVMLHFSNDTYHLFHFIQVQFQSKSIQNKNTLNGEILVKPKKSYIADLILAILSILRRLAVPIIYMLLWSEYNYRHALTISKVSQKSHGD